MTGILGKVAKALMQQQITRGVYAAPCFEFYPPDSTTPLDAQSLFAGLKSELKAAQQAAAGDAALVTLIGGILQTVGGLTPP